MKQTKYNFEQIAELLKNEYVAKCSSKAITYSNKFKVFAVGQYAVGKTPMQIFSEAGFTPKLVGKSVSDNCLRRWRNKLKFKGKVGLTTDERGLARGSKKGRPRTKGLTDADRIKRLEIENAYLKAKYDFLVKLRAQRKS